MTPAIPPIPDPAPDPSSDRSLDQAAGVAGLARDLEALRRDVTGLSGLARRVEQLGELVTRLAEATAAPRRPDLPRKGWCPGSTPTWTRTTRAWPRTMLTRLAQWVAGVYLRDPDALPARLLAAGPRSGRGTARATPGLAGLLRRRCADHARPPPIGTTGTGPACEPPRGFRRLGLVGPASG